MLLEVCDVSMVTLCCWRYQQCEVNIAFNVYHHACLLMAHFHSRGPLLTMHAYKGFYFCKSGILFWVKIISNFSLFLAVKGWVPDKFTPRLKITTSALVTSAQARHYHDYYYSTKNVLHFLCLFFFVQPSSVFQNCL